MTADTTNAASSKTALKNRTATALGVGAVFCFHLAFLVPALCWLILGFLGCLFSLRRVSSPRKAFYISLATGVACYAPHMGFMWNIFKGAAIPLWLILPFWLAVFSLLLWKVEHKLGAGWACLFAPVLWTGIEYFRCEIWWLRFSWLALGSADGLQVGEALPRLGVYGIGTLALAFVAYTAFTFGDRRRINIGEVFLFGAIGAVAAGNLFPAAAVQKARRGIPVAAVQLEFASDPDILAGLESTRTNHPETQLIVLSEYSFDGPPSKFARDWCRRHGKWLVAGGKEFLADGPVADESPLRKFLPQLGIRDAAKIPFRNTAFVINTNGEIVFTQAKAQPIQFFNDGLPAGTQQLWESPWGKIGIAICYDASFRRVTDELVRLGAQALIFPTMDVEEWGVYEHELNARQSRIRAAEYRIPVLRVASSGPSELILSSGRVAKRTEVLAQGAVLAGNFPIPNHAGNLPWDRRFAPVCMYLTGGLIAWLSIPGWIRPKNPAVRETARP